MKKMIFLKVKNSYNKKLVTWLDLNLQVAHLITKLSLKFIDKLINIFYNIYILFNFFTFNNHYI